MNKDKERAENCFWIKHFISWKKTDWKLHVQNVQEKISLEWKHQWEVK